MAIVYNVIVDISCKVPCVIDLVEIKTSSQPIVTMVWLNLMPDLYINV